MSTPPSTSPNPRADTTTTCRLELTGSLGLRDAADIAAKLHSAIAESTEILLSVEGLVEADVAVLQVLVAAQKTATAAGRSLRLKGLHNGALLRLLEAAGFIGADGLPRTPETHLWMNGAKAA